ncbi:MAG: GNAT family N-acetyltransferase, partial [Proteobacteria bacterium]|nr:GNAT family N-acetyltransferase [Pseudomonadota bacterium]
KKYIQSLLTEFGDRVEIVIIKNQTRPISAALCFHFNNQMLAYYGGASSEAYSSHAYTFMLWSVVKRAFNLGFEKADFGRSIRCTGSFNFKKIWGMEWQPLNYQTYLVKGRAHPIMDPASLRFRAFSNTWKRLPRFVVDGLSPLASRLVV